MSTRQSRQPAGVPVGGQWAAKINAEAAVTLDLFGQQAPTPEAVPPVSGDDVSGLDLCYASLRDANLEHADAHDTRFQSADLRGARMAGIRADGADFSKADLTGADISDGSFVEAQFRDAALSGRLGGADFSLANLERSEIASADNAQFSYACLAGATLTGHFENCDFRGVDFRATHMDHAQAEIKVTFLDCQFDDDPITDQNTEWPNDFDPRLNAQFRHQGFNADEQAAWQDCGLDSALEARSWRDSDFEPEEAANWQVYGWEHASHARAFRDAGLDASEAMGYYSDNLSPDEAVAWKNAGFRPQSHSVVPGEDVGAWHETGIDPTTASAWADEHYIASEAERLIKQGHTDPKTAPAPERHSKIESHYRELNGRKIAELRRLESSLRARSDSRGIGTENEAMLRAVERVIREKSRDRR